MKKKVRMVFICLGISMLLLSCGTNNIYQENTSERVEDNQNEETDSANRVDEKKNMKMNYQTNAVEYENKFYIVIAGGLYCFDSEYNMEKLVDCKRAVGKIYGDELYWAIWNDSGKLQIIKIDDKNKISVIGEIEDSIPISGLDFYKDILYIKYAPGNVEGYYLDADGKLGKKIEYDELLFYGEENQTAKIRQDDPNNRELIYKNPYHIIDAGYSMDIYGKEFLTKHIEYGEQGTEIFVIRENGKDTEVFSYFNKAFIYNNKVVYYGNSDYNNIMIYDLNEEKSSCLYSVGDGTFEILTIENDKVYGYWESTRVSKVYFAEIDLNTMEMIPYYEIEKDISYIELNGKLFYEDATSGIIKYLSIAQAGQNNVDKMTIEDAWGYLSQKYFRNRELEEIHSNKDDDFSVVIGKTDLKFSENEEARPCESTISYEGEENDSYLFMHHYVFFDENGEVFALKSGNQYSVSYYTGEVILEK